MNGSDPMSIQFVVNDQGKPVQVLLDISEYEELLERVEDTEAVALLADMKSSTREHRIEDR
jgi:hypothetical protein